MDSATKQLRDVVAAFSIVEKDDRVWLRINGLDIVGIDASTAEARELAALGEMRRTAVRNNF